MLYKVIRWQIKVKMWLCRKHFCSLVKPCWLRWNAAGPQRILFERVRRNNKYEGMKCEKLEADKTTVNGNKREKNARRQREKEAFFGLCSVFDAPSPSYGLQMWGASVQPPCPTPSWLKGEKEEETEPLLLYAHNHILITSGKRRQHTLCQGRRRGRRPDSDVWGKSAQRKHASPLVQVSWNIICILFLVSSQVSEELASIKISISV